MFALFSRPAFFAFLLLTLALAATGKRGMDMDPYGRVAAIAPEADGVELDLEP